ncbi:hypothetical protein Tco_0769547 [Tanacetum coccineum]|uniref:Gag-Pol polyprotein n=1 Tax=Tanacetum coccineum TaxID=301880 RepID=A0ABQ4ZCA9_9ASTR
MQQPIPNPEDITDPTTAMNMALALMAKAFKLNYSTTNTNFIKPSNLADAQPVQNVGNQVVQDAVQNQNGQIGVQNIGNGNVVAARAEGTVQSRQEKDACVSSTPVLMLKRKKQESNLQAEEFDLMAAAADLDEIEEVGSLRGGNRDQHPGNLPDDIKKQHKIERLQAQLGDLKGKSTDTPCVSNTLDPLSQKLENEKG